MENSSPDIITKLLSDKSTSDAIVKIINQLSGGTDSNTDKPMFTENEGNTNPIQSEKAAGIQRKIDVLTALKPLFGKEFSNKADMIINALNAAKIILSLRI